MKKIVLFIFFILLSVRCFSQSSFNYYSCQESLQAGVPITIYEFDSLVNYYTKENAKELSFDDYVILIRIANTLEKHKIYFDCSEALLNKSIYEKFLSLYAINYYKKIYLFFGKGTISKLQYAYKEKYEAKYWKIIDSLGSYIPNRDICTVLTGSPLQYLGAYASWSEDGSYYICDNNRLQNYDNKVIFPTINCENFDKLGEPISKDKFISLLKYYCKIPVNKLDTLHISEIYKIIQIGNTLEAYKLFDTCKRYSFSTDEIIFLDKYNKKYYPYFDNLLSKRLVSLVSNPQKITYYLYYKSYKKKYHSKLDTIITTIEGRRYYNIKLIFFKKKSNLLLPTTGVFPLSFPFSIFKIKNNT